VVKNAYISIHIKNSEMKVFKNISEFCTKGDGISDDTLAIQEAVNDVCSSGGTLYFNKGEEYRITKAIHLPDVIRLKGNGCTIKRDGIDYWFDPSEKANVWKTRIDSFYLFRR
jgi:polygalacturonase